MPVTHAVTWNRVSGGKAHDARPGAYINSRLVVLVSSAGDRMQNELQMT
jgi:hypothetical protein